jgi:C_GCAxxG_C_C family probable redox protein
MTELEAVQKARAYFLSEENTYGCAETTLLVLQEAYGLPRALDASAAMALNGGLAWSGGPCGALSGAALAVGRLAAQRISDHRLAKTTARRIVTDLIFAFQDRHGACNCSELIGLDISTEEGHARFIESKVWHATCMDQIEFVIGRLVGLHNLETWHETMDRIQVATTR